jgi:preprotein translocase subunit SecB
MQPSPLLLEGYYLKEVAVELNPKFEKRSDVSALAGFHYQTDASFAPEPINFAYSGAAWANKDESSRRAVEITIESVKSKKNEYPYSFRITLVGYFEIHKEYPSEKAELMFHANAPAILFGAAREMLASITARGIYPAVILPSVTFLDNAQKIVADLGAPIKDSQKGKVLMLKGATKTSKKKKKQQKLQDK